MPARKPRAGEPKAPHAHAARNQRQGEHQSGPAPGGEGGASHKGGPAPTHAGPPQGGARGPAPSDGAAGRTAKGRPRTPPRGRGGNPPLPTSSCVTAVFCTSPAVGAPREGPRGDEAHTRGSARRPRTQACQHPGEHNGPARTGAWSDASPSGGEHDRRPRATTRESRADVIPIGVPPQRWWRLRRTNPNTTSAKAWGGLKGTRRSALRRDPNPSGHPTKTCEHEGVEGVEVEDEQELA